MLSDMREIGFGPVGMFYFFPSNFELLENLRVLAKAVPSRQRMGKETWLCVNVKFWPVTKLPHQLAWPFVCPYSRNNFLFKFFHGKRARKT